MLRTSLLVAALFAAAVLASSAARAQSDTAALAAYDAVQRQADEAWAKLPFTTRQPLLVARKAPVFGAYEPRIDNTFRPGETIFLYIEPVGYTFKPVGPDMFEFGVAADLAVVDGRGAVVFEKRNFAAATLRSRAKAREFMLNYTINLNGCAVGYLRPRSDVARRRQRESDEDHAAGADPRSELSVVLL